MSEANGHGRRRIHFDPTINLGHVLTAGTFLISTVAAWVSLDARVVQQGKDIDRTQTQTGREVVRIETQLMNRINEERARIDQTQLRTADDIREIKTIVRDGFRDLDAKLDRKADKPGR